MGRRIVANSDRRALGHSVLIVLSEIAAKRIGGLTNDLVTTPVLCGR